MIKRKRLSGFISMALALSFVTAIIQSEPAHAAATISGRNATLVSANATTNITGISVGGLASGTTYLVAVGITNVPSGASLKLPTYTGLTASYGYSNATFASFTTVSFTGLLADVNTALASLQYVSGAATGSPILKVSAASYDASYALNGYNGHYYASSVTLGLANATYTSARATAKLQSYKGQSGYVVTITSAGENSFIGSNIVSAANIWFGATDELSEGTWKWDTSGGSPEAGLRFWNQTTGARITADGIDYASWSSGEPNNYAGSENYAVTNWGSTGLWNDCNNTACNSGSAAYVVEFGTNAADGGFINASSDLASNTFSLLYSSNATTTYSASSISPTYGTAVTLTATVTSGAAGTVTFKDGSSNVLCTTGNLSSGTANCSWTPAAATTYAVTAYYSGDGSYLASNSAAANVVVSTKALTIKAAAKSSTYTGSAAVINNSFTLSVGSLVGSDTFTVSTYTYTATSPSYNSTTAPTNAGAYTITPSGATFSVGNGNYSVSYDTATLTIAVASQAALTLTSTSGTYGTTLKLTTSGGSGTGAVSYASGTAGCTVSNVDSLTVSSPPITCAITATKAADSNYLVSSSSATNVTFATKPITIKAVNKSATYTGSAVSVSNSYTISVGSLVGSDSFTVSTYTYSAISPSYSSTTAPTNAGVYTITPSAATFSTGSGYYNVSYDTATLTISSASQAALTLTSTSGTYGTTLKLTSTGGSGTGAVTYASGTSGCNVTNGDSLTVTSAPITCAITVTKAADSNYTSVSSSATNVTFSTKPITIKAVDKSATYTASAASITKTYTISAGSLVGSDTFTVSTYTYSSIPLGYSSTTAPTDAGSYTITPSAATFTVGNGYYNVTYETATLTIDKAVQSALTLTSTSGTYGTTLRLLTSGGLGTGAVTYSTSTSGCSISNTDSLTVTSAPITCSVTATKALDSNYNVISSSATNVAFATRPITIKAVDKSTTYTASAAAVSNSYTISVGSLVGSDTFTVSTYTYTSVPLSYISTTAPTNAGTYTITPSGASFSVGNGFYNVSYDTATLTISKASQTALTLTSTSGTYGTTLRLTTSGGLGTGAVTYSTSTSGCSISNTDSLTVTTAPVTCSITATKALDSNYNVITSSATDVVMSTRPITIKAVDKSATYTASAASITKTYTISVGSLVGSDTFTVSTYTYTSSSPSYNSTTIPTNAGTYTITPSGATFTVGNGFYNVTYDTATLTISKAAQSALTLTTTTGKYGVTLRLITSGGSGTGAVSFVAATGTASACTISNGDSLTVSSFGTCLITGTKALDTNYLETSTIQTAVTFAKADAITVTAVSPSTFTYSAGGISHTNSNTTATLVNSDAVTALTYSYGKYTSCADGGYCSIGDTAPGGGIVFYDAGSTQAWGRYLEYAPSSWYGTAQDPMTTWCTATGGSQLVGTTAGIGNGKTNSANMVANCASSDAANIAAAYRGGGKSDWYLPNYEEFTELRTQGASVGFNYVVSSHWVSFEHTSAGAKTDNAGFAYKASQIAQVRPIRSFDVTSTSYATPSATLPSEPGFYAIVPSGLTLTSGHQVSYSDLTYVNGLLKIIRASDSVFTTFSALQGSVNQTLTLVPLGGSGSGSVIFEIIGSSATNCQLSGAGLSAASSGYCTVMFTRIPSTYYLGIQNSVTINFYVYVPTPIVVTNPYPDSNHGITISIGGTNWSKSATAVPKITSISPSSGPVGSTITITGTGFNGVNVVKLNFVDMTSVTGVSATSVTAVVPEGAGSGPIYIENSFGSDFNFAGFTVTS